MIYPQKLEPHIKTIQAAGKDLYRCGWKKLTFCYSGSSDSCDDLYFMLENEESVQPLSQIDAAALPATFDKNQLIDAFLALIPAGFENDTGGSGDVRLHTKTGKIAVEHSEYVTVSKTKRWQVC
jgi:hypothetical protein